MAIFLIRHTTPLSPEGICYGQADLPVAATFAAEAERIRQVCPADFFERPGSAPAVYSSPLERCLRLACHLWPESPIGLSDDLREMDFGEWENKPWDQIDATALEEWMKDFVHAAVPGGESYQALFHRCSAWWDQTIVRTPPEGSHTAIITHAGVIRSLLCHCTHIPLSHSFGTFPVPFGAVYRLHQEKGSWKSRLL